MKGMNVARKGYSLTHGLTLLTCCFAMAATASAQNELTIGSQAPSLDIDHWISDGGGKLKPVTDFEKDKVYVIEFWATWCPPCVASMPHIAELQKKMMDRNVHIISVSDEDLETVERFLDRPVPAGIAKSLQIPQPILQLESTDEKSGQADIDESNASTEPKKITFRELTSAYSLTTDPDQSVYSDYMEASGEGGIPTAFIVGKQGLIEWIGHPMELDEPLAQVVEGKWDRDAFMKERAQQAAIQQAIMEVYEELQNGKVEKGLQKLDALIQEHKGTELAAGLLAMRIQLLVQIDPSKAAAGLKDAAAEITDPQLLNGIAWSIVEYDEEGGVELSDDLLAAAVGVARKAVSLAPEDGAILDTLSHLVYMQGDVDQAIKLQTKAVELAPEIEELTEFLESLKKEKADQK